MYLLRQWKVHSDGLDKKWNIYSFNQVLEEGEVRMCNFTQGATYIQITICD